MGFREPFAAYNASDNLEAHLVCAALQNAGIEAIVVEDSSNVGLSIFGYIAEIFKPQVWIERSDAERAKKVLDEYESQAAERRAARAAGHEDEWVIDVVCDECGEELEYPASQFGSVQTCPHCNAHIDVGREDDIEGWDEAPPEAR